MELQDQAEAVAEIVAVIVRGILTLGCSALSAARKLALLADLSLFCAGLHSELGSPRIGFHLLCARWRRRYRHTQRHWHCHGPANRGWRRRQMHHTRERRTGQVQFSQDYRRRTCGAHRQGHRRQGSLSLLVGSLRQNTRNPGVRKRMRSFGRLRSKTHHLTRLHSRCSAPSQPSKLDGVTGPAAAAVGFSRG